MTAPAPIESRERLHEIDTIRGFALFGVLWLNLVAHGLFLVPEGTFDNLPTAGLDAIVAPVADFLVSEKAMTLFSLLFGFGFAMIISRLESRQLNAGSIFLRRTAILFAIGILHILFVWFGDILHVYALMGFALYLTRHWTDKQLLVVGSILALFSTGILEAILQYRYDEPFPWWVTYEIGAARHYEVLQGSSYTAYVGELWWSAWEETWTMPFYITYCLTALGRFMLGAWIFRKGWLQQTAERRRDFRRWALILFGVGIAFNVILVVLYEIRESVAYAFSPFPQLALALAYGAAIVALCGNARFRRAMFGVAAVGRTALSNYLLQSVMYMVVLYGFGFGLITQLGATLCVVIAVCFFGVQIALSSWWLAHYRFGPMEWLWRSLTYGKRQPMRFAKVPATE